MKMIVFAFCASALFLSGCIEVNLPEQKYQETRLFEIPEPASALFPFPVEVLPFRSDSPAKFKMLRRNGTELSADEYNKWAQTPARMMTRCFRSAFHSAAQEEPAFKLSSNILVFELDVPSASAVLSVAYTLSLRDEAEPLFTKVLTDRVKLKENTPEAFASAMEQAVARQTATVKNMILNSVKTDK